MISYIPILSEVGPHLHHALGHGQLGRAVVEPVVEPREVEQVAHLVSVAGAGVRDAQHALEQPQRAVEREPVQERGAAAAGGLALQPDRLQGRPEEHHVREQLEKFNIR